jgi:hypothetical protein
MGEKKINDMTHEELDIVAAKTASKDAAEKAAAYDAIVEIEERAAAEAGARQLEMERARARRAASSSMTKEE